MKIVHLSFVCNNIKLQKCYEFLIAWALDVKVVGLVTRKDLARYHMGKDGLEELHLAQMWLVVEFILDPAFRAPALDRNNSGAGQSLSHVKDAKHKPATCTNLSEIQYFKGSIIWKMLLYKKS